MRARAVFGARGAEAATNSISMRVSQVTRTAYDSPRAAPGGCLIWRRMV
jgi:hypothetical protein